MKKFNEWLESNGSIDVSMGNYGAGSGSVNVMGNYGAASGSGSIDVGMGMPPAQNADDVSPEQAMAELQKGEAGSYLRLIQRVTGQKVFSPTLVQALKRAITAAPAEMTHFLSIVGNMTVGQQGRATQGMNKIVQ